MNDESTILVNEVVDPKVLMYQPVIQEIYVERCKNKPRPSTAWEKDLKFKSPSETEFGNKIQQSRERIQNSNRCRYLHESQEVVSEMPYQLPQLGSSTSVNSSNLKCHDQRFQEMKSSVPETNRPESRQKYDVFKNNNVRDANLNKPPEFLPNAINDYTLFSDCGCLYGESDNTINGFSEKESGVDADYSNFYSYSQSQLHYLSEAESLKFVCTSKDSIHAYRLEKLRNKMMTTLEEIQGLIHKIPMHDGVEDLKRRQQRATEFSARFCRNYLYQLRRQVNDIRKLLRSTCYNPKQNPPHPLLSQKVVTAHQNACQALQAYLHHMPCSVQRGVPDKLQELLQVVKDLCSFCSDLGVTNEGEKSDAVDVVEEKCLNILEQIESVAWLENEIRSCASSKSVKKMSKKVGAKFPVKNAVLHAKEIYIKPQKICLSKSSKPNKKMNPHCGNKEKLEKTVPSKQPSNIRHLPATGKVPSPKKKANIKALYAGDDIPTMMEYFPVEHQDEDPPIQLCTVKNNQSTCLTKNVLKTSASEREQKGNSNILQSIEGDIRNMQKDVTILRNQNHPNYYNYKQILEKLHTCLLEMRANKCDTNSAQKEEQEQKPKPKRRNQVAHVQGEKNVKLICLPPVDDSDDDEDTTQQAAPPSIRKFTNFTYHFNIPSSDSEGNIIRRRENLGFTSSSYEEEENAHDEKMQLPTPEANMRTWTENLTEIEAASTNWEPQAIGKLCELRNGNIINYISTDVKNNLAEGGLSTPVDTIHPNTPKSAHSPIKTKEQKPKLVKTKPVPITLSIPDEERSLFLFYRKLFRNFTTTKSLYAESSKPWMMVSRIGDKLIYNTLHEVLNDIGVCNITSGLLELEFM